MKSLYLLPLLILIAGCGKPNRWPVNSDGRPIPVWTKAHGEWSYDHWECPDGYTTDTKDDSVECQTDSEFKREMEASGQRLQPK